MVAPHVEPEAGITVETAGASADSADQLGVAVGGAAVVLQVHLLREDLPAATHRTDVWRVLAVLSPHVIGL